MALTKTALIIIDVQKGMFDKSNPVYGAEKLLDNISKLIEKARQVKLPIIYIQHNARPGAALEKGSEAWEIHTHITPQQSDSVIEKSYPDSFQDTRLHEKLEELEVKELILCGIQTEVCVDTTTRRAFSQGYSCTLVMDAHSTWGTSNLPAEGIIEHHNQTLKWFAKVKDTNTVLDEMESITC